jgi:hypothetical protein
MKRGQKFKNEVFQALEKPNGLASKDWKMNQPAVM